MSATRGRTEKKEKGIELMKPKIFWAGDSTVAHNNALTYPQAGLAQGIRSFIKDEVEIKNHAINGRSTKSFLDEYRLAPIYDRITAGDFLLIQFGHNDEKKEDPLRYTHPEIEYSMNLGKFIAAAENKKAYPVLITPLYRRSFQENGHLFQEEHKDYQESMKKTAIKHQVPCIDLCGASKYLLEHVPQGESRSWFMNLEPGEFPNYPEGKEDNTHLQERGAQKFGELLASGLKALGGIYQGLLASPENINLSFEGDIIYGK